MRLVENLETHHSLRLFGTKLQNGLELLESKKLKQKRNKSEIIIQDQMKRNKITFHARLGVSTHSGGKIPFQKDRIPSVLYIFLKQSPTPE